LSRNKICSGTQKVIGVLKFSFFAEERAMAKNLWSEEDKRMFGQKGLTEEEVTSQLDLFEKGRQVITLDRPCTVRDGIVIIPRSEINHLV
jgi:hypothetical protein